MIARTAVLLLTALAPLAAQTRSVQDYLPLAVGNSWTYAHLFLDARGRNEIAFQGEITISILRTEVIDGDTYYVFSDVSTDAPEGVPKHFLAGKKLRWDGNNLTEHDGASSLSLYRFDVPTGTDGVSREYSIPETHGHTSVKSYAFIVSDRLMLQSFQFSGEGARGAVIAFSEDFGLQEAIEGEAAGDMLVMQHTLTPIRAVFQTGSQDASARDAHTSSSAVTVEWDDYLCYFGNDDVFLGVSCNYPPTSTSSNSWGLIKEGSDTR